MTRHVFTMTDRKDPFKPCTKHIP